MQPGSEGSAKLWVLDVLMGMQWDMRYHSCIPGVGVLGTRAGPGILPNILIEACMNDLAYPVVYWDWHRGICDRCHKESYMTACRG